MKTKGFVGIVATCTALLGPKAFAQSVYVDFGFGSAPSSSYAAAAGAPGVWNGMGIPVTSVPLVGLQGEATGLLFTSKDCDSNSDDFPTTSGDHEELLDDWYYGDCFATSTKVTITGLGAGDYMLYVYPIGNGAGFGILNVDMSPPAGTNATISFPNPTGPFPGSYSGWFVGTVQLNAQANSTLSMTFQADLHQGWSGMQLVRLNDIPHTGSMYCFGDGSSVACPCGNPGLPGRGCGNLLYPGAQLSAAGTASVAADTLVLNASSMSGALSWYFQGTAQAAEPFGYGILCVGGSLLRVGQKGLVNGSSSNPSGTDLPLSIKGAIPPAGGTRHYQVSYRQANPPCVPAPASNINRTNGVTIVWTP